MLRGFAEALTYNGAPASLGGCSRSPISTTLPDYEEGWGYDSAA